MKPIDGQERTYSREDSLPPLPPSPSSFTRTPSQPYEWHGQMRNTKPRS